MEQRNRPVQERILDAAEKLFAERGYKETTTREIVKEAEASLSSIHAHFQGKENIYCEVRCRSTEKLEKLMQPSLDEVRYLDQHGMLHGEVAWNLLYEIVAKYVDWSFDPANRNAVMLVGRELLEGVPVPGLSEEFIEDKFSVMQLLCERYTETQGTDWSMLVGRIVFSPILPLSGDRYKNIQTDSKTLKPELLREELKYQVKSYILLGLRAYLDIRKNHRQKDLDNLMGQM